MGLGIGGGVGARALEEEEAGSCRPRIAWPSCVYVCIIYTSNFKRKLKLCPHGNFFHLIAPNANHNKNR